MSNRTSVELYKECIRKYGSTHGKDIYGTLLRVFAKLPIALIVDDAVLCTHSAIPSGATPLNGLLKLPRVLPSLERNCKLAYDIITRYPKLSTVRPKPVTKTKPANKQANCKAKGAEMSKSAKGSVAKSSEFGSIKSVSTGTIKVKHSNSDILFVAEMRK